MKPVAEPECCSSPNRAVQAFPVPRRHNQDQKNQNARNVSKLNRSQTARGFGQLFCLAGGNEKLASEYLIQAVPFVLQASQQPAFCAGEGLVCGVVLQIVANKLKDQKRLAVAAELLKLYSPDQVRTTQGMFMIPERK
jgi:hypothetical protein